MGLKNSQYQAIMRKYEQKQLRNHDILTQHYEEVYRQLPEFKSLDDSISILSVQYGKRLLNGAQKSNFFFKRRACHFTRQQAGAFTIQWFSG